MPPNAAGGWVRVGSIPEYALLPCGGLIATVVYYRRLAVEAERSR